MSTFWVGALQAASRKGNQNTIKLLLGKGANINIQGGKYSTALQAAASCSLVGEQMVEVLLANEPTSTFWVGSTALLCRPLPVRATDSQSSICWIRGPMSTFWGVYGTALAAARSRDHDYVVRILVKRGGKEIERSRFVIPG